MSNRTDGKGGSGEIYPMSVYDPTVVHGMRLEHALAEADNWTDAAAKFFEEVRRDIATGPRWQIDSAEWNGDCWILSERGVPRAWVGAEGYEALIQLAGRLNAKSQPAPVVYTEREFCQPTSAESLPDAAVTDLGILGLLRLVAESPSLEQNS